MMALLEVKNLKKEFRRNGKSFFAVDGVGLSLDKGVFASVMGESGSGKSTLLNLIAGLLLPTSGEVLIDGTNLSLLNDSDLSAFRNSSVGHIPQGLSLLANLNALDNIRLPFFLSKRKGDPSSEARKLLRLLGIEGLALSYPSDLSGGEAKRAAIARALINKPALILADEPTENLDADIAKEIVSLFKTVSKEGTAVLMVTHDERAAAEADCRYFMRGGRLFNGK